MPNELLLLKQLAGNDGWLSAAILISLFLIVILRRDSIALPSLFRLGVLFFALSIAIPPLVLPLGSYIAGTVRMPVRFQPGNDGSLLLTLFMNGTGPALQALTVLCIFNAIMPRVFHKKPESIVPQKHPLDD